MVPYYRVLLPLVVTLGAMPATTVPLAAKVSDTPCATAGAAALVAA